MTFLLFSSINCLPGGKVFYAFSKSLKYEKVFEHA
jgi:hypothetical protein